MIFSSKHFILFLTVLIYKHVSATNESRTFRRIHIPLLGFGPSCVGCPQSYCDDNPAIVQGFCCGCARILDNLPVSCSPLLTCPLNTYDLCQRYEYMMYCCCGIP